MKKNFKRAVISAMCLALAMVLPVITGGIPKIGNMLCPMHIPVLLCGFICGPWYGLFVGAAAPILRSLTVGMPPMFPKAVSMAFELAAYGFFSGFFYRRLPKKNSNIYLSLILAMIIGRLVWGAVQAVIFGLGENGFGLAAFISGAFTTAIPGIILQLILIPAVIAALKKAGMMKN